MTARHQKARRVARRRDHANPPPEPFGRAVEIRYVHVDDGQPYKHEFGRDVWMEAMPDGSLRIYKTGSTVWSDL